MIRGIEFHSIIKNIFHDVKGIGQSEQIQVNCPKCQEREGLLKPDGRFNLEINTAKRVFHCWKCDQPNFSGSLGKLIKYYGNYGDYKLYKDFAGTFSGYYEKIDEELEFVKLPDEFISFNDLDYLNPEHVRAYMYLTVDRKIPIEKILKYRLGFCITGDYSGRIIIPSYDSNGDLNYFVARSYYNIKPPYLNPDVDKNRFIFNEGFINWDSTIYLVEGVFDMFSVPNATPLLGKELTKSLFYALKEKKPNVIIVLDPDAYSKAISIYLDILNIYLGDENKVKIVKLSGVNDIDEIRVEMGHEEVLKSLKSAKNLDNNDYFMYNQLKYVYKDRRNSFSNKKWKQKSGRSFI